MLTRRSFVHQSLLGSGALLLGASGCQPGTAPVNLKISLAQWSLHRTLQAGKLDHLDFPAKAKRDFGVAAVEYVNTFFGGKSTPFKEAGKNARYLNELLKRSRDKGVSAKTYDFDARGEQPKMDYKRLLDILKKSGFQGYIGIEFEGNTQPEAEGIRQTKALIERYW